MEAEKDNAYYISKLPQEDQDLIKQILELKEQIGAKIFAHNYQRESIQLIADVLGDSLALARAAQKETQSNYILLAGVRFMAQTASVLNPDKTILFPENTSKCSMAAFVDAKMLKEYKKANPNIPIILYINSTAEAKTMADVVCTSANALKIVKAMVKEFGSEKFGFSPDKNLGNYISKKLNIPFDAIPATGNCYVHNNFTMDDIKKVKSEYPRAKLLIHPETPMELLEYADFIGSTSQIIQYPVNHPEVNELVIGTENGVTELLRRKYPDKKIIPLSEDAYCYAMKRITLNSILNAFKHPDSEDYIVKVDEGTSKASINAINKMMILSQ